MSGLGQLTIEGLPKKNKEENNPYGAQGKVYWKHKIKKIRFARFKSEGTKRFALYSLSVYSYFFSRTYLNPR